MSKNKNDFGKMNSNQRICVSEREKERERERERERREREYKRQM